MLNLSPVEGNAFWARVEKTDGCWQWKGPGLLHEPRYGRLSLRGRWVYAHRVAYELVVGSIPADKVIDHLCGNRGCVNPSHLEVVAQRVNVLRADSPNAQNARKHYCIRGHEFTPENTQVPSTRPTRRHCRQCQHLHYEQRRAALAGRA